MKLLFRCLLALIVAGACSPSHAQKPTPTPEPVQLAVSSPFAAVAQPLSVAVKFGRWFPVAVTISNTGDAVAGEVSLRLTAKANDSGPPSTPTVMSVASVDLPQNSRKRIWLYGRIDGEQWDGATVRFQARGARTQETPIDLKYSDLGKRLILTVSDAGEPFKYLDGFTNRALESIANSGDVPQPANASRPLLPVSARREAVPDRWVGLEGADAVVLHDFAHSALSPSQVAALRGYVAAGGTLVVPAGANWQRLASSPLADLWPVVPQSSTAASAAETREIVARGLESPRDAADRLGGSPALLTRGSLQTGARRVAGTGTTALEAVWPRGAGRVVWLAFDPSQPPFVGWRGQEKLWLELSRRMQTPPRFEGVDAARRQSFGNYAPEYYGEDQPDRGVTGAVLGAIRQLPQLQMPPTATIAWFLAGYVFLLVPVNYFILRAFDRREWAWFSVPIIAIAFSIGSYLAARSIKGTDLLRRHVTLVQGGQGLARVDAMLWVRSPRRAYYTVFSPNPSLALSDYQPLEEDTRTNETRIRHDDSANSFRAEDVSVPMWTEAQFIGQGTIDVKGGLEVRSNSTVPSLVNNTPFKLSNVVVIKNGGLWRCTEELAPKAASPLKKTAGSVTNIAEASELAKLFAGTGGIAKSDKTLSDLANAALRAALGDGSRFGNDAVVVGWSREAISPLVLSDEAPVEQNVSLFVLRLPSAEALSARVAPRRVALSRVSRTILEPNRAEVSPYEAIYEGEAPAATSFTLSLVGQQNSYSSAPGAPAPAPPGNYNGSYKIQRNIAKFPKLLQVSIYNNTRSRWEPLTFSSQSSGSKASKAWRWKMNIQDAAPYVRQPDGIVRVQTRVANGLLRIGAPTLTPPGAKETEAPLETVPKPPTP
ncbi:MAG TPA: hypothetical protein VF681_01610 [Abditibacteriaceae bacterium]|jgi:hypothetical protein